MYFITLKIHNAKKTTSIRMKTGIVHACRDNPYFEKIKKELKQIYHMINEIKI
jgi:hypothetical protein